MTDSITQLNQIWEIAAPFLSKDAATYVAAAITTVVTLCSIAARFWKPPAAGTKLAVLWKIVTYLAQARGWSAPAYQPGRKSVMISRETSRTEVADKLGVDPLTTAPAVTKLTK